MTERPPKRSGQADVSSIYASRSSSPVVLEDGVFLVEDWLPYEFSFVANKVSATLEQYYKRRFGFTVAGWRVVAALGTHPGISPKELAIMIGVDQVSITRAVAILSELGMIVKRGNTVDRRSVNLRLSSRGRAAYQEVLPLARQIERILLSTLSAADRSALRAAMAKVVEQAASLNRMHARPPAADAAAAQATQRRRPRRASLSSRRTQP